MPILLRGMEGRHRTKKHPQTDNTDLHAQNEGMKKISVPDFFFLNKSSIQQRTKAVKAVPNPKIGYELLGIEVI